jgi:hypothetical protein
MQYYTSLPAGLQNNQEFGLTALYRQNGRFYLLESHILITESNTEGPYYQLVFLREKFWIIGRSVNTKKKINDLSYMKSIADKCLSREELDTNAARYLKETISIAIAAANQTESPVRAIFGDVTVRGELVERLSDSVIRTFDQSIEYLEKSKTDNKSYALKFFRDQRERTVRPGDMDDVLSAGTIRGSWIVDQAVLCLKSGGYLLVDEIENHLNKQLVGTLLALFNSNEMNPHGATLVFTTHYPEVLDFIQRKDNIYFLVRDEEFTTALIRYSDRVKRIENKKSEVFLSNFIKGTAPKYSEVAALKRYVIEQLAGFDHEG